MGYAYSTFKVELVGVNYKNERISIVHDVTAETAKSAVESVLVGARAVGFSVESCVVVAGPIRKWWGGDF